jgi:hypothetical protein
LKVGGVTIIFDFCQNSTIPKAYAMNDEDRNAALERDRLHSRPETNRK